MSEPEPVTPLSYTGCNVARFATANRFNVAPPTEVRQTCRESASVDSAEVSYRCPS